MKTEKISDVLQGMDVNTEDAIVTLSDKIWEIGSIDEIRQQVSDVTFTFHVVTNVIGNCQGDGWMSIVEYHADLLPYISSAMYEIGLDKVGEATKNIANIFPLDISVLSDSEFCKVVNFMKGHKTDLEELKKYSESEQEKMSEQYFDTIDKLDEIAEKLWYYGCPDNEGWGVVSRYLEKHLEINAHNKHLCHLTAASCKPLSMCKIKNKSSMELKQYLKTNCHWENRVIISPNELVAIYSKANYQPTSKLIDFLIYFYNQEFQFPKVDVHFNLKKTLNDNPHYLFYNQFCELLHVSDICPFGEYEHGYMVLLVDSKNNIYGVMDDYVEGFGNDYFKMLNQLYNR